MKALLTWRIVGCGATVAVVFIILNRLKGMKRDAKNIADKEASEHENLATTVDNRVHSKEKSEIKELSHPRWIKVGEVQQLYYYPLKSGRGKEIEDCQFTEYGIAVRNENALTLRDRMFLVYNEETGKFITGRNYPTLILVSLSSANESSVQLEATGVPNLTFQLPQTSNNSSTVECKMWWGESVKCIDCGSAPAQWISNFLTGTDSGLRIGITPFDRRNILKGPWEKFIKVYSTLRNEDTGLFADLASYMLMSTTSLDELNRRLKNPTTSLQFRPNIVVSGAEPFAEDNWEWIKIGDSAVIRNVKPCPRCSMVRVDPTTGLMNEQEPLKTLQSFREQTDERRLKVDGKSPTLGIYCGLYSTGNVKIGDDVYVHTPKTVCTTSL